LYGQRPASADRSANVTLATFDPKGSVNTQPQAINPTGEGDGKDSHHRGYNPSGAITGYYSDAGGITHGFLRTSEGKIVSFDPTGSIATSAYGINTTGTIVGNYQDAANVTHGFLRDRNGTFTSFDPPGSQGIFPFAINSAGMTTGYYYDSGGTAHGFLRTSNGTFTSFDPTVLVLPATNPAAVNQPSGIGHGHI
jgi:uncharacterized membrane protein